MALIELAQLSRHFSLGDSTVHALRELSLTIDAGEYVAVIGPSGSMERRRSTASAISNRPRFRPWV